ncbi:MAG: hypothetical protein WCD79_07375 [Chthoniobacteraceae bacterium]
MKKYIIAGFMVAGAFLCAIPQTSRADEGQWDKNHHYRTDKTGYFDEHHKHHDYTTWHHHRGYWDEKGDKRIFITIGG